MAKAARKFTGQGKGLSFLHTASENYISSRTLYLNNQLYDAGVIAHEALEKVMKALLYLKDPNREIKHRNRDIHDLTLLYPLDKDFQAPARFQILSYYQDCYNFRYPDNPPPASFSSSTHGHKHLDVVFMGYHDLCLGQIANEETKYRSGIYDYCMRYLETERESDLILLTKRNERVTKEDINKIREWWVGKGYLTPDANYKTKMPRGYTYQALPPKVK